MEDLRSNPDGLVACVPYMEQNNEEFIEDMNADDDIVFYGDPHGAYGPLNRMAKGTPPGLVVFVGDMDLDAPLQKVVAPIMRGGADIRFIHGNHDTDRDSWYDNLFESELSDRNISGHVVDYQGVRIAGLGGVFREEVWHPRNGHGTPRFNHRDEFVAAYPMKGWRDGLPRKHRSTIFPEDMDALAEMEADVLVTHEAPSCHRHGFEEIDLLAQMMGCHTVIHGHHHESYSATIGDIQVFGLNKAQTMRFDLGRLMEMRREKAQSLPIPGRS